MTTTLQVLSIPADASVPMRLVTLERGDLTAMQALVGGWIEPMWLPSEPSGCEIVANEEGLIMNLPMNVRASDIARQYGALARPLFDYVAGDVYLQGPVDDEGWSTSVPKDSAAFSFCKDMAKNVGESPDFQTFDIAEVMA